VVYHSG